MPTAVMTKPDAAVPSRAELIARARGLTPLLAANAARTEKEGRIPLEVLEAVRDAGLLRLTSPKRFGGYQLPFRTVVEVVAILAEACASTCWVTGYANTAKWMISLWQEKAQNDVFAGGPDFIIAGSGHKPTDEVKKVEGGYVFSGKWASLSAVPYSDWVGIWLTLPSENGEPPRVVEALIPASEVTIENTWAVAGMKGTGSESVVAKDVFVPEHRIMDVSCISDSDFNAYPTPFKDEVLYRGATHPVLALAICLTPVGLAQGAVDLAIDKSGRPIAGTTYSAARDSTAFQLEIAEAAQLADTARLHMFRAAEDIDHYAKLGEVMPPVIRARVRADCGWTVSHACAAIDRIMTAVGSGAFADANPLQRMWRDANTAARHGAVNKMLNAELYGAALLGIEVTTNRLKV